MKLQPVVYPMHEKLGLTNKRNEWKLSFNKPTPQTRGYLPGNDSSSEYCNFIATEFLNKESPGAIGTFSEGRKSPEQRPRTDVQHQTTKSFMFTHMDSLDEDAKADKIKPSLKCSTKFMPGFDLRKVVASVAEDSRSD